MAAALALSACASQPHPAVRAAPAHAQAIPQGIQYLYGSGEAGALEQTVFHALIAYVTDKAAHRPENSVVLAAGSPLVKASFVPCGGKPLAAVFDADETVLLNTGFEGDEAAHPGRAFDEARWQAWERTGVPVIVPGAGHAFEDLRKLGFTVIINTNRSAANAAATAAALKKAGLGDFTAGDTLFLREGASGKDARRAAIAAKYCVVAMAGDQLGDFSDRFADPMPVLVRRQLAVHSSAAGLWGKGWFVLPNPAYGSALKGSLDDIFPADKRWSPAP